MKKMMYLAVLLATLSVQAATPPEVGEKVLKAFKATFTEAADVSWVESIDNCQADFLVGEIRVRAIYDHNGGLQKTIRYYKEKNLPGNIRAKIMEKYAGKEIFGVTEIVSDEEVSYYISLKDEKNWYRVKPNPYAVLELLEKFKRAD